MDFRILGPLEVFDEHGPVALGGIKPRAVLAVLLLHRNESVNAERLSLALWGEDVPASAVKTVQVYVSRLRKALGDAELLTTTPAGYCLRVREAELDAERFAGLVEDGRRALAAGRAEHAAAVLREALSLWRGPPLADLAFEPFAQVEIARLDEQRLAALEVRVEADLAVGHHAALVAELRRLVRVHPTRERLAGQLMLALYRCGRQTDALDVFRDLRRVLLADMGLEPGPELRRIEEAILRQDPSLEAKATTTELPPELDAAGAPPLVGRGDELARLRSGWERARSGRGTFVTVTGVGGIGKSRLAAELADDVHRLGATVLFVDGAGAPDGAMTTLGRARQAVRPTLLVVEDADRAGDGVLAELSALALTVDAIPLLAIATGQDAEALARVGAHDSVPLGPLEADAVAAISAPYAPSRPGEGVPAESLLLSSAGIPRRVHEVAARWGQREAARQLGATAGRAAMRRSELRTMEHDLAGDIIELQVARGRTATRRERTAAVVCPFKGLASFDFADAEYFFGRERLVAQLVAQLVGAPLLAVVGPSGSGKSSVVRAGLLPALASGVLPGSERWTRVVVRPAEHPLRSLAAGVAMLDGDSRFVLVVDQFEETFTACDDERERAAFVAELARTADAGPGVVVLAVRADHYGGCASYPALSAMLAANHVLVGPMRRDELLRAVTCPAERAGLRVDPDLADALVADVEGEPGALPLLSASLLELWQRRDGSRMSHAAYAYTGGVRGAVARLAEDAFTQLDQAGRAAARDLVMRLVGLGADGEVECRRVAVTEVAIDERGDSARVLALFTDRRLLTVSTGTVEVAHEALLREWPRLTGWIDESRDALRIQRALAAAAREWQHLSRDDGALYRGSRLAEALDWRDASALPLTGLEREFLDAGEAGRARDDATRRRRIRLVSASLALVAAAVVAIVATALFADRERDVAASRDLAEKSSKLLATDPGLAVATAFEALRRRDTKQAQNALRQATFAHRETHVVRAHPGLAFGIAPSPNGRLAATAGGDGIVSIWDVGSGKRVAATRGHRAEVRAVSFSRDGRHVASAALNGSIAVTALRGGARRVVADLEPDFATSIEFGARDRTLVVGTNSGRVARVSLPGGALRELPASHHDGVLAVRFDDEARRLASTGYDGVARISDIDGTLLHELDHHGSPVLDADFSPSGHSVATVDYAGALRIWNARDGEQRTRIRIGDEPLASVRFSDDGRIVAGGYGGVLYVVTLHGGGVLTELRGHRGPARAGFAGGRTIVSVGEEDGTLRTWMPPSPRVSKRPGTSPAFSRDGRLVVSGDADGPVHVWVPQTETYRELGRAGGHADESYPQPASAGHRIVSTSLDDTVRLWDADSGRSTIVPAPRGPKLAAALDASGRRIAIGGRTWLVIQAPDGSGRTKLPMPPVRVNALEFSPDARHLLSGTDDAIPRVWDARSGVLKRTLRGHDGIVRSVSYSNDGRLIATAGSDGTIRVWPPEGGDPAILVGHESAVNSAAFDDSGDRLVSAGDDGTIRVWDSGGGEALAVLHRYDGVATGADFGDGSDVVSAGDGIVQIMSCEVCGSAADALRVALTRPRRSLSSAVRRQLLPGG